MCVDVIVMNWDLRGMDGIVGWGYWAADSLDVCL